MRVALSLVLSLAVAGPALAQGSSSESDMSQQGGAVRSMGSVGGSKKSVDSGIVIPNYGGDVSAIRRLPAGTTGPRSRSFVRAPRQYYRQHFYAAGTFEPRFLAAWP